MNMDMSGDPGPAAAAAVELDALARGARRRRRSGASRASSRAWPWCGAARRRADSAASTRRCCRCSPAASTPCGRATSTAPRSTSATSSATWPGCATWTEALARWANPLSRTFMYASVTRVHELQIISAEGDWDLVEEELRRESESLVGAHMAGCRARASTSSATCGACVATSRVRRRPTTAPARSAWTPSPARRLMLRAAGRAAEALAELRVSLADVSRLERARMLLPAVELALEVREPAYAAALTEELEETAAFFGTPGLVAPCRESPSVRARGRRPPGAGGGRRSRPPAGSIAISATGTPGPRFTSSSRRRSGRSATRTPRMPSSPPRSPSTDGSERPRTSTDWPRRPSRRPDRPRGRGAGVCGVGREQPQGRRGPGHQRQDREPSSRQHLHQDRRLLADRRGCLGARSWRLTRGPGQLTSPAVSSRSCSPTSRARPSSCVPSRPRTRSPPSPCTVACCGRSSSGTAATSSAPRVTRSSSSSRTRATPWPPPPTPSGRWPRRPGPPACRSGCAWDCTQASRRPSPATTWVSTSTGPRASPRRATAVRCCSRRRPAPPRCCRRAWCSVTSASTASKDLAGPEWIHQLDIEDLERDFPPLNSLETPSNLPAAVTPLVGRDDDVAAVEELVGTDDVRLVTITGPGGTGKTRLALAAAARLGGTFRNGLVFVDLTTVTDPSKVAGAIELALELPTMPGSPRSRTSWPSCGTVRSCWCWTTSSTWRPRPETSRHCSSVRGGSRPSSPAAPRCGSPRNASTRWSRSGRTRPWPSSWTGRGRYTRFDPSGADADSVAEICATRPPASGDRGSPPPG